MAIKDRKNVRILAIVLIIILFGLMLSMRFFLGKASEALAGKNIYGEKLINPESFIDFGNDAKKDKKQHMAADIYAIGAKYFPSSLELWHALAETDEQINNVQQASVAWKNTIRLAPNNSENYFHLAHNLYKRGMYPEALNEAEKAFELQKNSEHAQLYVKLLNLNHQYTKSQQLYQELHQQDPENVQWLLGNKWASATPVKDESAFLKEIKTRMLSKDEQGAGQLVYEYETLFGNTQELQTLLAEVTYLHLLKYNKEDAQTWYVLANFYEKYNRLKEAEWAIRNAVAIDVRNIEFLAFYAYIELKLNQWSKANALYQHILSIVPSSRRFNQEYVLLKQLFPLDIDQHSMTFEDLMLTSTPLFETYVDWWGKNWQAAIETMPLLNGMLINLAFDNWGKMLDPQAEVRSVAILRLIDSIAKKQGVKIIRKLSFGGSTYPMPILHTPSDAIELAKTLVATLDYFYGKYFIEFDGVDLDIESKNDNTVALTALFISSLRKELNHWKGRKKIISLTIVGQAWTGYYYDLATNQDVIDNIDYIQFMEYGGVNLQTTLRHQIENDILTYITPKGGEGPIPNQKGWGIPHEKVVLGIKPGEDHGQYLTPDDTLQLAQFVIQQRLKGIMIWNTFRDFGDEGGTGNPPFTYTKIILNTLYPNGLSWD